MDVFIGKYWRFCIGLGIWMCRSGETAIRMGNKISQWWRRGLQVCSVTQYLLSAKKELKRVHNSLWFSYHPNPTDMHKYNHSLQIEFFLIIWLITNMRSLFFIGGGGGGINKLSLGLHKTNFVIFHKILC